MLRNLSIFYDGEVWNTIDHESAYEIVNDDNPIYKEALEAALFGATTVHPLANRYSGKAADGKIWHVKFQWIAGLAINPADNAVRGFAYTKLSGTEKFVRIHFTQSDSDMILSVVNNHYRNSLIRDHRLAN